MTELICTDTYRLSERSVLRPGVRFRATAGPVFRLADGTEVSMAARGPFTFRRHCKQGRVEYIEAADRDGANAILHIKGKRKTVDEAIVARPYRIKGTIRKKARAR